MTLNIVFPKAHGNVQVFTPEQFRYRKLFFNRMAKRTFKHGNWRQVWIDCGGMCIYRDIEGNICGAVDNLYFHEPFGEDHNGWGMMQSRIILCGTHHHEEHNELFGGLDENWRGKYPVLNDDVQLEIWMHGSYDQWVKDFNLQDTFWRLLYG